MARSASTFPYELKRIEEGTLVDPRVTIELQTRFGFLPIKFLVDSGADVTTLPLVPYASSFRFKKKASEKITIGGVEGRGVAAYPFVVIVKLGGRLFRLRSYFIESPIDPLLGRLDVWELFSIHFDNKAKRTMFSPIR